MNFNVLLQNVGASQLSYFVTRNLNVLGDKRPDIDPIVFYENIHKNCIPPKFAVMQIAEAWGQDGAMIATSLSTAFKLINFPAARRLFYVWDLEWLRHGQQRRRYEQFADVYTHPNLELIARSESHAAVIENAFNRKVEHIISDFNTDKILELIS